MSASPSFISRGGIVYALSQLRQEWEQAASEISLIEAETSVGLFLYDLAEVIGLTPDEQTQVLGSQLASALIDRAITVNYI